MSVVIEKIKAFEEKTGMDINEYIDKTIDEFVEKNFLPITTIEEFFDQYWNKYKEEYLKDCSIDFETNDIEELKDIVHTIELFPYTHNNYKSTEIKLEIIKNLNLPYDLDEDFFDEKLIESIQENLINGCPISHFNEIIRNKKILTYDVMKEICKESGGNLFYADSSIITKELIEIATGHEDEILNFNPTQGDFYEHPNLGKSEILMTYLCGINGQFLSVADASIITEKLIKIAVSHEEKEKNFQIQKLNNAPFLWKSKIAMEYFCGLDGRCLQYADSSIITKDLIEKAMSHEEPEKRFALGLLWGSYGIHANKEAMEYFCGLDGNVLRHADVEITKDLIEIATNHSDSTKNCTLENFIMVLRKIFVNTEILQCEAFQGFLKEICTNHKNNYEITNYILERATKLNDEILRTLNFEFLQEKYEQVYSGNGYEKLFVLTMYPDIQKKIIEIANPETIVDNQVFIDDNLGAKRLELLSKMLKDSLKKENGEEEKNWIPYYGKIIRNFVENATMYDNLINDSIDKLNEDDVTQLTNYALGNHKFKINSIEELRNYDNVRLQYIETINNNSSDISELKDALFERIYGCSLETAKELVIPYSQGVLSSPELFPEYIDFFKGITQIYNEQNIDILKNIDYVPIKTLTENQIITAKTAIKKKLVKIYNDTLYKTEGKNISDNIEGINIYKVGGENGDEHFNLSMHALGAYSGFNPNVLGFNYKNDWNRPKIASHGFCTSYIGNNNLGTAKIEYSVVGFNKYAEDALLLGAPEDIVSRDANFEFDTSSAEIGGMGVRKKSNYLLPSMFIDYTRHTHNEIVYERREKFNKKQPSYVVFFCDDYDEAKEEYSKLLQKYNNSIEEANDSSLIETLKKQLESNHLYHTLKTSKDFGNIPIVVVEREKIAKNEHKKIFDNLDELEKSTSEQLTREEIRKKYHDIIVEFENNHAGNREYHINIDEKYFGEVHKREILKRITARIQKERNVNIKNVMIDELEKVALEEESKSRGKQRFNLEEIREICADLRKGQKEASGPKYITDFLNGEIQNNTYLSEYNKYLSNLPNQLESQQVLSMIDDQLKDKIETTITTMYDNNLYAGRDESAHSKKHIEDVILFSGIIGKSIGLNEQDLDLLMTAAMYHDAGRVDDKNTSHATSSAYLAIEELQDKYNSEDLKIICSAIAYHEVKDERNNDNSINYTNYYEICKNFNLNIDDETIRERAIKIANCLKDADALDRTRFVANSKQFTNPNYLRYDISKTLIKTAEQINESYATKDLKELLETDEEIMVDISLNLEQTGSPKETLRNYRKGYLNNKKLNGMEGGYNHGK